MTEYSRTGNPAEGWCLYCGQKLRKAYSEAEHPGYGSTGLFCMLRCGFRWAVRVARSNIKAGVMER